jgi:hypothetical protein
MNNKNILVALLGVFFSFNSFAQVLNEEEKELYRIIMAYRDQIGLPKIPLSASLSVVAQTHVKDLAANRPDRNGCNLHSWSSNGSWAPCCYTPDHAQANCMWSKPRELTKYPGNGYEISHWDGSENATAAGALGSWKQSSGHNAVIVNQGIWSSHPWKAIGIGIYNGYAVVWFGEEADSNSK